MSPKTTTRVDDPAGALPICMLHRIVGGLKPGALPHEESLWCLAAPPADAADSVHGAGDEASAVEVSRTRSSALGYACAGMAVGAALNALFVSLNSGWGALHTMGSSQWTAALFLGAVPGAIGFFPWVYAVQRTTPTRAAATITVSPISAGALAAVLVAEPFGVGLAIGAIAVILGIWIASTGIQGTA